MIEDIEDNYPEYLEDELGYAWDAWDVLPADVIRRHDSIVTASAHELDSIDPAALDDLDRWAYARACRRSGDVDGFLSAARLVVASKEAHHGLQYAEVFIATIGLMATEGLGDEALLHLSEFRERWPEDSRAVRLEASVTIRQDPQKAIDTALTDAADDADRLFEIAEDVAQLHPTGAEQLLQAAESLARGEEATSLLLDIDLLRAELAITG